MNIEQSASKRLEGRDLQFWLNSTKPSWKPGKLWVLWEFRFTGRRSGRGIMWGFMRVEKDFVKKGSKIQGDFKGISGAEMQELKWNMKMSVQEVLFNRIEIWQNATRLVLILKPTVLGSKIMRLTGKKCSEASSHDIVPFKPAQIWIGNIVALHFTPAPQFDIFHAIWQGDRCRSTLGENLHWEKLLKAN